MRAPWVQNRRRDEDERADSGTDWDNDRGGGARDRDRSRCDWKRRAAPGEGKRPSRERDVRAVVRAGPEAATTPARRRTDSPRTQEDAEAEVEVEAEAKDEAAEENEPAVAVDHEGVRGRNTRGLEKERKRPVVI
jgi:hypothetical protein